MRWHRAVASRSIPGEHNPRALSRLIHNELNLDHLERKSFLLPCGKTVAESWAGLRKAWLGFKIALSNGNVDKMKYYASFITKVQMEMGIEVTNFDTDILDEESNELTSNCFYKKHVNNKVTLQENKLDYDSMMNDARGKMNTGYYTAPMPRLNIFERSKNSCSYLPLEKEKQQSKIVSQTSHTENSCHYKLPAKTSKSRGEDPCYFRTPGSGNGVGLQEKTDRWESDESTEEIEGEDPCYFRTPGSGNGVGLQEKTEKELEKSGRRSCFYKGYG